jgi:DNA-directed RNA polymerase subunit F
MLHSDHIINLHEDVFGNLKTDKQRMLSVFETFEKLDPKDQRRYQLARRMGRLRSVSQMALLSPEQLSKIDEYLSKLTTEDEFEAFLLRFLRQCI